MIKIEEGKQVGVLYHYTSMISCMEILRDDTLKMYNLSISFTRNKWFHRQTRDIAGVSVRFVIDGDKLSQSYKIEPYSYPGIPKKNSESEERIVGKNVTNFSDYVIRVEIYSKEVSWMYSSSPIFVDMLKYLGVKKSRNISTELVKSYIEKKYGIECQLVSE